jgi:hypothetical protein
MAIRSLDHGHGRTGNVVMLEVGFIRGIIEGKEETTMIRLVRAAAPDDRQWVGSRFFGM